MFNVNWEKEIRDYQFEFADPSVHPIITLLLHQLPYLWPCLMLLYQSMEFKYFLRLKIKLYYETFQTYTGNTIMNSHLPSSKKYELTTNLVSSTFPIPSLLVYNSQELFSVRSAHSFSKNQTLSHFKWLNAFIEPK